MISHFTFIFCLVSYLFPTSPLFLSLFSHLFRQVSTSLFYSDIIFWKSLVCTLKHLINNAIEWFPRWLLFTWKVSSCIQHILQYCSQWDLVHLFGIKFLSLWYSSKNKVSFTLNSSKKVFIFRFEASTHVFWSYTLHSKGDYVIFTTCCLILQHTDNSSPSTLCPNLLSFHQNIKTRSDLFLFIFQFYFFA